MVLKNYFLYTCGMEAYLPTLFALLFTVKSDYNVHKTETS